MMRFIFLLLFSRPAREPLSQPNRSAFEFTFSDGLKRLESAGRHVGGVTRHPKRLVCKAIGATAALPNAADHAVLKCGIDYEK
jgi:hypothetical protein